MPIIGIRTDFDRVQKRWVIGALGIAFLIHLIVAGLLGWYKIPGLKTPYFDQSPAGPFNVKEIEINPDSIKPEQENPIAKLPVVEPPKDSSQFNLDPNLVEKTLQAPQASLSTPSVPEPSRVVAATDLGQGLPFAASDQAKVTAEISRVDPTATGSPAITSKTARDLISATAGLPQPGLPSGSQITGNGTNGKLPGFSQLVPAFRADTAVSNLPEPVLLRLPSDVLFDFDSAQLKPEAGSLLTQAVGLITKYPQASVQIDGYTDSFGKSDYNLTLSQQRAEAVQAWLEGHALRGDYKFRAQGHGSADYIVIPPATIDQQQANRRVEILIQALKP
ncbi:MAG TPA: OmpA family protein [Candidatus Methylacidiphilales bacterium]|nr:OmpA family protein [Candidatus Methylacidiphilales bacterium]